MSNRKQRRADWSKIRKKYKRSLTLVDPVSIADRIKELKAMVQTKTVKNELRKIKNFTRTQKSNWGTRA